MSDAPNVILVTFDSLSAGDMSLYGYRRPTTPFIDCFAHQSYVFDNMQANSNSSIPSLASILTGRYPLKHGSERARALVSNRSRADDLADVLRSKGYRTAAVIGLKAGYLCVNSLGQAGNGWMGRMMASRFKERSISGWTISLDATFRKTLEVLDSACRPFFLWLHIYPPHEPYLPSRSFRGTFVKEKVFDVIRSQRPFFNRFYPEASQPAVDLLRGRYNEHILEVDHRFGGLLESIEARGLFDTSMIIVTADHGEMFERGYQGHNGPLLYNPLVHVPLIVRLPGGRPGTRVEARAEQVDIAPTILDLLGFEIPGHMHGESLVGAMLGGNGRRGDGGAKPKFAVSSVFRAAGGGSYGRSLSVVSNGHKLILDRPSGACELYDLVRDPGETHDIAAEEPDMGQELEEMILESFSNSVGGPGVCHDRR